MPIKSYIEPNDLPTDGISNFADTLNIIKYGEICHSEKPEVIVVKESFFLRNEKGTKIGVFTRSEKDHSATIGDCRVLVNSDFMREEAEVDNHGKVSYDVNARLHEHLGAHSSQFRPPSTDNSVVVHFTNPKNNRKYIFIVFEMVCVDFPPPLYLKLKTRKEDAFVGLHDVKDVAKGIDKYNKNSIEVDQNLINLVKPKRFFNNTDLSVFKTNIKNSVVSSNVTLMKINLFGIG